MDDTYVDDIPEMDDSLGLMETLRELTRDLDEDIRRQIEANILYYFQHYDKIGDRIDSLDREWDVERVFRLEAGLCAITGTVLGLFRKQWLMLPAVASCLLVHHALTGWCPVMPIYRWMKLRTVREILLEKNVLKLLRGDYRDFDPASDEYAPDKISRAISVMR